MPERKGMMPKLEDYMEGIGEGMPEENIRDYDFSKFDATGEKLRNFALLTGVIAAVLGLMMIL